MYPWLHTLYIDITLSIQTPSLLYLYFLYFRTVHVVIFILFKPTHAFFLKYIHI